MRIGLLLVVLPIVLLTACSKSRRDDGIPERRYLSQIIYGDDPGIFRQFEYDNEGRLSGRVSHVNGTGGERLEYQYTNTRLSRIELYSIRNSQDQSLYLSRTMSFEYQNDRVVKTEAAPPTFGFEYRYDDQGRVTGIISQAYVKEFAYDSKGNVSQMTERNPYSGLGLTYRYHYDDKINPLYRVDPINNSSFGEIDIAAFASPNNMMGSIAMSGSDTVVFSTFTYVYNDDNLPVTSAESYRFRDQISTKRLSYKYESR